MQTHGDKFFAKPPTHKDLNKNKKNCPFQTSYNAPDNAYAPSSTVPYEQAGWTVSNVDNGQLLIGTSRDGNKTGIAYLLSNQAPFQSGVILNQTPEGVCAITGNPGDNIGKFATGIGDVNGDGIGDLALASSTYNQTYVIYNNNNFCYNGFSVNNINGVNGVIINSNSQSPCQVSSAGDVNGDKVDDILIQSCDSATVHVVFGGKQLPNPINTNQLNGTNGFTIKVGTSPSPYSGIGFDDINNDGFDDIVAGYTKDNTVYVLYGHKGPFPPAVFAPYLNGTDGFSIVKPNLQFASFGSSVYGNFDINQDGNPDLFIGDPTSTIAGMVYIVLGEYGRAPFPSSNDINALINDGDAFSVEGQFQYSETGQSLGSIKNLAGHDALIIGAPNASPNGQNLGSTYAVFSSRGFPTQSTLSSLNGCNGFRIDGGAPSGVDDCGYSVASVFNLTGHGYSSIVMGAPSAEFWKSPVNNNWVSGSGAVYIFNQATIGSNIEKPQPQSLNQLAVSAHAHGRKLLSIEGAKTSQASRLEPPMTSAAKAVEKGLKSFGEAVQNRAGFFAQKQPVEEAQNNNRLAAGMNNAVGYLAGASNLLLPLLSSGAATDTPTQNKGSVNNQLGVNPAAAFSVGALALVIMMYLMYRLYKATTFEENSDSYNHQLK